MSDTYQVEFDGCEALHDALKRWGDMTTRECRGRVQCYTWGRSFLGTSVDTFSTTGWCNIWIQRRHERLERVREYLVVRGDEPAAYWAAYTWTVAHLRLLPFRDVLGIQDYSTKEWLFTRPELEAARTLDALRNMA